MRAILNIMTNNIAAATGWRAREIRVDDAEATLGEVMKRAPLKDGKTTLFDLIADEKGLKPDFGLFVSGELVRGEVNWSRPIVDSEQIHVCDWPIRDA